MGTSTRPSIYHSEYASHCIRTDRQCTEGAEDHTCASEQYIQPVLHYCKGVTTGTGTLDTYPEPNYAVSQPTQRAESTNCSMGMLVSPAPEGCDGATSSVGRPPIMVTTRMDSECLTIQALAAECVPEPSPQLAERVLQQPESNATAGAHLPMLGVAPAATFVVFNC